MDVAIVVRAPINSAFCARLPPLAILTKTASHPPNFSEWPSEVVEDLIRIKGNQCSRGIVQFSTKEKPTMVTLPDDPILGSRLSVRRCAAVGVIVFGVLFLLCWVGAAVGWVNASHMYISLFTIAPVASVTALAGGLCWSVVFGGLTGALTALAYNAMAFLSR